MLNNEIFYHGITRKTIVAFGSLFSDIKIKRQNVDNTAEQTIAVPIAYAPKEKWLVRIEQDSSLENNVYTVLPRLSFEITGFSYDAQRKFNRGTFITCYTGDTMKKTFAPVPYNIEISLYALAKTSEDGLQIMEQIVPYFSPELMMTINSISDSNIKTDIPVILNSVNMSDEYDGDFQTRRFVTYTFSFTLKAWMYGPVMNGDIIKSVFVNTTDSTDLSSLANLEQIGSTTTGDIATSWNEY
jgi:hypothetical protein